MKKKLGIITIASLMAVAGATGAQAVVNPELKAQREQIQADRKEAIEERKEERQEKKEEAIEQRCTRIQERIQNRIGGFDDNKEKHMKVYENMVERVEKFIEKLSADGYDTSKVATDLKVLEEKIAKFSTDKDARLDALNETKNYACGKSEGEFKAKLAEARKALQLVHADAVDIRKYVQNVLHSDIQALRKQKMEDIKEKTNAPELE
jgi:hypothetical protein